MLRKHINALKAIRKNHPLFFFFALMVIGLYGFQLLAKIEITPMGYFSLYSDAAYPQEAYFQVLPEENKSGKPYNIYRTPGTTFLMLEILPTRYDILRRAEHCNPMNPKLKRLGLYDGNTCDCDKLEAFHDWFPVYLQRVGLHISEDYDFKNFGFKNAAYIRHEPLQSK